MSFWDKVKEFVGVDEDYIDDEFYEDYDDLEDYKDDDFYDDKSSLAEESYEDKVEITKPTYKVEEKKIEEKAYKPEPRTYSTSDNTSSRDTASTRETTSMRREERPLRRNVTTPRESTNSSMHVTIREPLTYEDGKVVLDDIMDGRSVVLNLEMLEVEKKTQIFYFVSGGLYSLNGTIQNVTKDIYVLAPHGVEIDSAVKSGISSSNLYQL